MGIHFCRFMAFSLTLLPTINFFAMNNNLLKKGYIEIENKSILKENYKTLYKKFDVFIEKMSNDKDFANKVYSSEKMYAANEALKKRYCNAPPSYRDPVTHPTKRFNKIYCQYIVEHHELLKQDETLPKEALEFYSLMNQVDSASKAIFHEQLQKLEKEKPGIQKLLYGSHTDLTVISKIVRYKKDLEHKWGTTPHFDKSALSLILDSDDKDNDSLLICEDVESPSIESLHKPHRMYAHKEDATSALLIPGLAFKQEKWDIKPTLHGVAAFDNEYRHAIISFLLIPDIDMANLQTDYEIN